MGTTARCQVSIEMVKGMPAAAAPEEIDASGEDRFPGSAASHAQVKLR